MKIKQIFIIILMVIVLCSFANAQMCGKMKEVSAGEDHSLALMEDGTLMACGSNLNYVLGIGSNQSSFYTLQKVCGENGSGYLHNVATFDAGWYHSLAADTSGNIYSWGKNTNGQLGNETPIGDSDNCTSKTPKKVKGVGGSGNLNTQSGLLVDILHIDAGWLHSLALDNSGNVWA